ncbi:MAG: rhodanese-like domain-containing protein [Planctomycetes bacterium]|nr:rhodanese-like domain-containing protein [Planctomycetota bacterium]
MKRMLSAAAAIAVVAVVGMASLGEETYPDIKIEDLKKAMEEKTVTLIDCNGTETYAKSHLPGAKDFKAVEKDLAKNLPEDKGALVVAYCGSSKCTAYKAGADAVAKLGYTNVKHFSAGLKGWTDAGEKTEGTGEKTEGSK